VDIAKQQINNGSAATAVIHPSSRLVR